MYRRILILILTSALLLAGPLRVQARTEGEQTLLSINDTQSSIADFKSWWQNWREEGMSLPETPQPFIDWQLLASEAERMELYREPTFQHKMATFLKVRTLMRLKYDEVDSKIKITEQDLRALYDKEYSPRQRIRTLLFKDSEAATAAYRSLHDGTLTLEDLAAQKNPQGGPAHTQESWVRPNNAPAEWKEPLQGLSEGEWTAPFAWHGGSAILRIEEQRGADDNDFAALKGRLTKTLRRQQETALTGALGEKLIKKFQVTVNEELLHSLDINNVPADIADKPIMTSSQGSLTTKDFVDKLRSQKSFLRTYGFKQQEADLFKQQVMNSIISQSVTTWEALARHYEQIPPLKAIYQFYRKHRLILELKNRLFAPKATVSEAEIAAYYQEHREKFSRPGEVTLAIVADRDGKAEKFWMETTLGKDFFDLAEQYYGQRPKSKTIPLPQLDEPIRKVAMGLNENETSRPFAYQGHQMVLKLIHREAATPLPLSSVAEKISGTLYEQKMTSLQADYLRQLKAKSSISVNDQAWQSIQKDLGETE